MLLAVHYRVMEHLGSLESTQEARVALGYRLGQLLSPGQTITTCQRNIVARNMLRTFGHPVAICCDVLGVVGSNLKMAKFEPTTPNTSQHGGQTHATCCAQQCCDVLRWHVAIVWPGRYASFVLSKLPACSIVHAKA